MTTQDQDKQYTQKRGGFQSRGHQNLEVVSVQGGCCGSSAAEGSVGCCGEPTTQAPSVSGAMETQSCCGEPAVQAPSTAQPNNRCC
ncbi:hypothetical protein [Dictyobacter formicarum]|uniref:hypothetical protein n=1 Tax=Dictyobacter formicarum TaxID=2778368 RepID=UPI001915B042|nr:hypothetical protein [Dictyobacter formicarum]